MKKYVDRSFAFAIYGLASGVFFREFTKFNGFTDRTMLGFAHPHILALGFLGYLLIAVCIKTFGVEDAKKLRSADMEYMVGLIITSVMMIFRGILEVRGVPLSRGLDASISGVAGLGHIAVALGVVRFLLLIRKAAAKA